MLHLSASPPQKARFHIAFLLVFIPCCLLAETEEFFWINWCDSSSHCSQRATDTLQQSLNKQWTNTEKYSSFLVYSTGSTSTEIWCMTEMFETPTEVAKKQRDYHESMKYCANLSLIFTEVSAVLRSLLSHFIDRTSGCTGFLWTSENVCVVRTTKHWLRLPREVVEFLKMGKSHLERILAALGGSALMICRGPVKPLNSQRGVVQWLHYQSSFSPRLALLPRCHILPEQWAGPAVWWGWRVQTFPARPWHQEIPLCRQLWGSTGLDWNRGSAYRWSVLG